jgi:hypothetical protein
MLKVEGLFLKGEDFSTYSVDILQFDLEGIVDAQKYRGHTRTSDAREKAYFDKNIGKGEEVLNWRQVTAVEDEEMWVLKSAALGLPETVNELEMAQMLGANILFSDQMGNHQPFSKMSAGSLLKFPSGAILYVTTENLPCDGPGNEIHKHYPEIKANGFQKPAMGLRGILAMVFRPGIASLGDIVEVGQIRGS